MSGKRERPRDLEIDEKTLEYKGDNQSDKTQKKISTPQQIAARKIYKIKTTFSSENQQQETSKPNFKFIQTKDEKDQKEKKQEKEEAPEKNKEAPKEQKEQEKKPVFAFGSGNIFGNSIFGKTSTGFSGFGNQAGLFSKPPQNKSSLGEGLFSKKSGDEKSGSMFGKESIFNFSSNGTPPLKKQGEVTFKTGDDDEGDSAQLQKEQKEVIDPSKSSGTYVYEAQCEVLFSQKAKKVKKGKGDVIENIEIMLQFDKSKNNHWLIVRMIATKKEIVSGLIVKKISEIKNMNEKNENVWVSVLVSNNQKLEKQVLKIQFEQAAMGKELIDKVTEVIKSE